MFLKEKPKKNLMRKNGEWKKFKKLWNIKNAKFGIGYTWGHYLLLSL